METDLPVYPEQALQEIDKLIRKAIEYGKRISEYGSEDEIDREVAKESIEKACLSTIVLLEQYADKHGTLIDEARSLLQSVKADPVKLRVLEGEVFLTWPWQVQDIVDIFRSMHFQQEKKGSTDIAPLLNVINNAEYYITNPRVFHDVPGSEDDIHVRIEGMIKCLYPDVITKPRLSKPIKSFDPDTGIPSLKTLIEYKYIKSLDDGKKIIDEILADIGGYQTDDYDKFVLVLYETHRLFPLSDWTRAIEKSRPPNPIEIILMKGVHPSKKVSKSKRTSN